MSPTFPASEGVVRWARHSLGLRLPHRRSGSDRRRRGRSGLPGRCRLRHLLWRSPARVELQRGRLRAAPGLGHGQSRPRDTTRAGQGRDRRGQLDTRGSSSEAPRQLLMPGTAGKTTWRNARKTAYRPAPTLRSSVTAPSPGDGASWVPWAPGTTFSRYRLLTRSTTLRRQACSAWRRGCWW